MASLVRLLHAFQPTVLHRSMEFITHVRSREREREGGGENECIFTKKNMLYYIHTQ